MPRTIIVPIVPRECDAVRTSPAAMPPARVLAERTEATVVLVTAVDVLPSFDPLTRSLAVPTDEAQERRLADAGAYLAGLADQFPDRRVQTIARWGNTLDVIIGVVSDADDPVLVVASQARQGLRRVVRGSVAFRLVHEAPCPVLVVRGPRQEGTPTLASDLETVLVPLDRSPFAEHALEAALAVLGRPDVRVHLLHVIEPLTVSISARKEAIARARPGAEQYLRNLAERLMSRGYRVMTEVRDGNPSKQIAQAAAEHEVDLIAMATHGLTGLSRRLLGSTAERLLAEIATPLLLVRPDAAEIAAARELAATEAKARTEALRASPPPLWDRRVDTVMTTPAIVAVEETPLVDLVATMLTDGIGCVPIVDADDHLVGIVTETDFIGDDRGVPFAAYQVPQFFRLHMTRDELERVYAAGRNLTAAQIMSHPVDAVTEDEPVSAVVAKMLGRGIKRVPVVREGVPVGVVARRDLLKLLLPGQRG